MQSDIRVQACLQRASVVLSAVAEELGVAEAPASRSQPAVHIVVQAEGAAELCPTASTAQVGHG